jgi:uncharacterized membrane protein
MPTYELKIPTNRLETLTDGIFAIAMTLLVLSIAVPTLQNPVTPFMFQEYVISILPQIFIYVLSFVLLAIFWLNHHIFFLIKRTNIALLWINIFWLISIAIVPFSTSIMGKYSQFQLSILIFELNILIIGILSYINWYYASKKGFIDEKLTPYSKRIERSNLALPILATTAMIISFISPLWSIMVFLLVPIIFTLYSISKKHKSANE